MQSADALIKSCTDSFMANIRGYTDEQLQDLLADDTRLDTLIDSLPQVMSLPSEREVKLAQAKSFAECNLSFEPKVKEARETLLKTYTGVLKAKQEVEDMKNELDGIAEERSLDVVSALIQASAREAEDESEKLAERFYSKEMEVDEFVRTFEQKRMLAHKRKVKAEKLNEILQSQHYSPATQPPPVVPARTSAPYPVNSFGGYPSVPTHPHPGNRVSYPRFT